MDRKMEYFAETITPMSALTIMQQILDCVKDEYKQRNKEEMLEYMYDLYQKSLYFMKDFQCTPESMKAKLGY